MLSVDLFLRVRSIVLKLDEVVCRMNIKSEAHTRKRRFAAIVGHVTVTLSHRPCDIVGTICHHHVVH